MMETRIMSVFDYNTDLADKYIRRIENAPAAQRHQLVVELFLDYQKSYNSSDAYFRTTVGIDNEIIRRFNGMLVLALRGNKTARKIFCYGINVTGYPLRTFIPSARKYEESSGLFLPISYGRRSVELEINIPPITSDKELERLLKTTPKPYKGYIQGFVSDLWDMIYLDDYLSNGGEFIENWSKPVRPLLYRA